MNYEQFLQERRALYEAFASTVATILQAAIDTSPKEFRLQQIQSRAKDPTSLRRKLVDRDLLESNNIENEIKDLAGCRLILYTNTDVDRLLSSRIIFENFFVDFDGSKIHHSVGQERTADELYFAIHYLVSLKPERLALPEYSRYRGLRCEIQIQTILDHAWAETTHDIIYHRQPLKGFGTRQFEAIKARTAKIMNKYLLPAGYEFQKVQHDFERLMQGKELFDRGTLEAIDRADNNNDRYEGLHRIKDDLIPFYDDVPAVAPEIIRIASDAIKKGRSTATALIETPFGNLGGHTSDDVVNASLAIIDELRYVDILTTFRVLSDLYKTASSNEERRRILRSVESLAHNDINVWRQVGFAVQKILLEEMSSLAESDCKSLRPVILTVCSQILNPELTGTSWSFDSVSLQRGAVQPSQAYAEFRDETIALLFRMYKDAKSTAEKSEVLQTLSEATRFPMTAALGDALTGVVLDNARAIVEFFLGLIDGEPPEIVQHLEHQFFWIYRHNRGMSGAEPASPGVTKVQALVEAIERFREHVNGMERFVRFKTLVGYESVFPPQWEGDFDNIQAAAEYRSSRIKEYVASISDANAEEWYDTVEGCASIKSNDGAMFPNFTDFLTQLSMRSPSIVFGYLNKNEDLLSPFLPAILAGLERSERREDALGIVDRWIDQGRHLAEIARHARLSAELNVELVRKIGEKALAERDAIAVTETIAVVVEKNAASLVESVFIPGIRYLTSIGDTRWIYATWFMQRMPEFFQGLTEEQCKPILENLVLRPRIDHHEDKIIRAIASVHSRSVWLFFKGRIDRENARKTEERYEAVPFDLRETKKALAQDAGLAIDIVRTWYSPEDHFFEFRGGRLLHNVFPELNSEFEAKLLRLVHDGDGNDIAFVMHILRNYRQGQTFLHNICKEIIEVAEDDRRLGQVELILQSTGVVSGQFGFVEAFQRKKQEIEPWLNDPRSKVRNFAERYLRSLDRSIAAEQRRSEADYELRRREWGDEE